ncbi:hypothetical protein B0H13DRAFT_1860521 [Mycena leptocephala]|nr:hypothetical protein B0H13DRAFT_1860521 [Mycena leptocephala]
MLRSGCVCRWMMCAVQPSRILIKTLAPRRRARSEVAEVHVVSHVTDGVTPLLSGGTRLERVSLAYLSARIMRYDGPAHVVLPRPLYLTQVSFDSHFLGKLYNPIVPVKVTACNSSEGSGFNTSPCIQIQCSVNRLRRKIDAVRTRIHKKNDNNNELFTVYVWDSRRACLAGRPNLGNTKNGKKGEKHNYGGTRVERASPADIQALTHREPVHTVCYPALPSSF